MNVNIANLILLLPVACTLAVLLAATGSQVMRPRMDVVRTFILVLIWLLICLAMFGLLVRQSQVGMVLLFGFMFLAVSIIVSERSLARSTILLALLAQSDKPNRLQGIARYLKIESVGYWKRLGRDFEAALSTTGNWMLAVKSARIARDEYDHVALGVLEQTGNRDASVTQIMRSIEHRQQGTRWRGRLVAASISLGPLLVVSFMMSPSLGPVGNTFVRMMEEFGYPYTRQLQTWVAISQWQLHIIIPVLVWGGIFAAYLIRLFPALRLQTPVRWFYSGYHRALCLEGLGEVVRRQPHVAQACRDVARAMPVTYWSEQLSQVANRVDSGEEFVSALKKNGLLGHQESTTLALCQDHNSLAWALHEISQAIWLRIQTRTNFLIQFLVLVLVLISACLTALIAMSVIGTLSDLTKLTEEMSR